MSSYDYAGFPILLIEKHLLQFFFPSQVDKAIGTDDDVMDYLYASSSVSQMDLNLDVYDFFRKNNVGGGGSGLGVGGAVPGGGGHTHEASSCCNYDIDSVSQISALDSASQTGGKSCYILYY